MVIAEVKKSTEQKMHKSVDAFKTDLAKVRTGRAHTGLLDHVVADYYGTPTPLNQIAKVILIDARTIGVTPFEKKMIQAVDKAIREADLGLNPATTGDTVRVPMPALTEERRRELIKVVKHEAENARIAVRNLRRDAIHSLKECLKKKEVSENDERRAQDEVQKMTDRNIAEIDKLLQQKETELLAVRRTSARRKRSPGTAQCHAMWRSSWTATGAGRRAGGCRASRGTGAAWRRCAKPCAPASSGASNT